MVLLFGVLAEALWGLSLSRSFGKKFFLVMYPYAEKKGHIDISTAVRGLEKSRFCVCWMIHSDQRSQVYRTYD